MQYYGRHETDSPTKPMILRTSLLVLLLSVSGRRTLLRWTIAHCRGYSSSLNTVIWKWFLCRYLRWTFVLIYCVMCTTIITCIQRPTSETLSHRHSSFHLVFFSFALCSLSGMATNIFLGELLSFDPFIFTHSLFLSHSLPTNILGSRQNVLV